MKIYTKTGDQGDTSLLGGKRVKKDCLEIDAIGEVDELNGVIGVLIANLPTELNEATAQLTDTQHRLFTLGANIAAVQTELIPVPKLTENDVKKLEDWIDAMEKELAPLTQFILPGGHVAGTHSFYARAICRRAERKLISVNREYPGLDPLLKKYLNRLSDALFVLGRWINKKMDVEDVVWKK